jgi:hypothetical protein
MTIYTRSSKHKIESDLIRTNNNPMNLKKKKKIAVLSGDGIVLKSFAGTACTENRSPQTLNPL